MNKKQVLNSLRMFLLCAVCLPFIGSGAQPEKKPATTDTLQFQQIRSATVVVTIGGIRFLVDPWFADKDSVPPLEGSPNPTLRSPVFELPFPIKRILDVDAVIVTHLHFDHFDQKAIDSIPKNMPIFAQDEIDAAEIRKHGFKDVRSLKYKGVEFKGVQLFKTGGHHGVPGVVEPAYEAGGVRAEACGIVFRHPKVAKTLYIAGDSIWCDWIENTIHQYKPDVIVLNTAEATLKQTGKIIMGLDDIREVLKAAPDAIIIASHMDNVSHSMLLRKDIRKFVRENSLESRILVPEDGEVYEF